MNCLNKCRWHIFGIKTSECYQADKCNESFYAGDIPSGAAIIFSQVIIFF